tara:strand:- start:761 stop:1723 length:963 start_codon:yes stop_codon:yes gene_type:complete
MDTMHVLVTGGCGYKGHVLVPKLLKAGHKVTVLDKIWFGNFLEKSDQLVVLKGDISLIEDIAFDGFDAIIHLASIANDPCGDLDPLLTWETSCLATMQLADKASRSGVSQFIYASSGSVYGVKSELHVTEDLKLEPISEYNKTKMVSEKVLLSYADRMNVQIVRPATVCGVSPRMRFDVAVNMLVMQAVTKGEVTVFGGNQIRPNIHIDDICDLYLYMLNNPHLVGVFNAGFENLSILEIAEMVRAHVDCKIKILDSVDPRTYRLDSSKLIKTGFAPCKSVSDAIQETINALNSGILSDQDCFHNLSWMKQNQLVGRLAA